MSGALPNLPDQPADPVAAAAEAFIEGPAYDPPALHLGEPELRVDLGAYEGPLDLLLKLAREQKVDLAQISVLALAEQYLAYIHGAQKLRLEIAADYLVMAAWLAYLKSRLLLPKAAADEPDPAELAALLAFQLQRLAAMQKAGQQLLALPQLGVHTHKRGAATKLAERQARESANENKPAGPTRWDVSLYELLSALSTPLQRQEAQKVYRIAPLALFSTEEAYQRLSHMLGMMPEWSALVSFMPIVAVEDGAEGANLTRRSALAATFVASLELAKNGLLELRQEQTFGNIYLRRKEAEPA